MYVQHIFRYECDGPTSAAGHGCRGPRSPAREPEPEAAATESSPREKQRRCFGARGIIQELWFGTRAAARPVKQPTWP